MDTRNAAIENLQDALSPHFSLMDAQVLLGHYGLMDSGLVDVDDALVILSPAAMSLIAHLLKCWPADAELVVESKQDESIGKVEK